MSVQPKSWRRAGLEAVCDAIDASRKDFNQILIERHVGQNELTAEDAKRVKLILRSLDEARCRVELSLTTNDMVGGVR